jgi:drug/metabolite transporter (DMT)-like permease
LELLLAALLFSTGGVAIKLAQLGGMQVAGLRAAAAALVLAAFVPAARRGWSWRIWVVAIPYAATFILYTLANKETTAANAIFLQDTAPLYLLLLSPWLLRERIERWDVVLLVALGGGAALLFLASPAPAVTAPRPQLGNVLALAAGATWALALLGLRWIAVRGRASREEPLAVIVAACVLTAAAASLARLPEGLYPRAEWRVAEWALIAYLGVFQIGLAYVFVTRALRAVAALEASLLLLTEPVFAPLWAWLVLGETVAPLGVAGGALIVAAAAANALLRGVSSSASPRGSER